MRDFVHLHVHSHYSLLDGMAKINDLVQRAKELGMHALALTDHGVLYGVIEFYKACRASGIKPIIGIEAYIAPASRFSKESRQDAQNYHLILLAKNYQGYKNLLKLSSLAHLEGFYYKPRIDKELLRQHSQGLISLSACPGGEIGSAIIERNFEKAKKLALEYQDIFGKSNFYLEIQTHPGVEVSSTVRRGVIELSQKTGIPLIATHDIHYLKSEDAPAHDILLSIQTGNKLSDPDRLTLKDDDFSLTSKEKMNELFKDVPEALDNTVLVAQQCELEIPLGKFELPHFHLENGLAPIEQVKHLANQDLEKTFKDNLAEAKKRLNYELDIIDKTGFASYFLIVHDIVNYARQNNISYNARGSAGGSLVCYLLGITKTDPIKYGLYFERFLNPQRIEPPDIDVDFDDKRRDEIFDYVKKRFGQDKVAQIITFGTMAARAAVRDVGRAMNLPYAFCDKLAKIVPANLELKKAIAEVAELKEIYKKDEQARTLLNHAQNLEGVARHASVHACGIVITPKTLTEYLPLQRAPQDELRIITQYEMYSILDIGLLKMDFLGLRNLTIIEETKKLIKKLHNFEVDTDNIPHNDKETFRLLQKGDTTGVFQLEGQGMRHYLKELKPTEIEDIMVMISLFRPGPMELIPHYIARKHKKEQVEYLHQKLEPIFKNTYGIMIYQEQLMAAAQALAGLTLAQADVLRKAVGKKIRALLQAQKEKLIKGCLQNGVSKNVADQFWQLVEPFDRYGFNRAHAISYALVAYKTAYLKAHFPVEFIAAIFNSEGFDVERAAELKKEAREHNIKILPPDINNSAPDFAVENNQIRFGLAAVKNVGWGVAKIVAEERERNGPFQNIKNFLTRINHRDLNKKSLESLIKVGAFDNLEKRHILYHNLDNLLDFIYQTKRQNNHSQAGLFGQNFNHADLRLKEPPELSLQEMLSWEKELLGFYVSGHPLSGLEKLISKIALPINRLPELKHFRLVKIAGVLQEVKRIITKSGTTMLVLKVEDLSGGIEAVAFPKIVNKYQDLFQQGKILLLSGQLDPYRQEQFRCEEIKEINPAIVNNNKL